MWRRCMQEGGSHFISSKRVERIGTCDNNGPHAWAAHAHGLFNVHANDWDIFAAFISTFLLDVCSWERSIFKSALYHTCTWKPFSNLCYEIFIMMMTKHTQEKYGNDCYVEFNSIIVQISTWWIQWSWGGGAWTHCSFWPAVGSEVLLGTGVLL